MSIEHDSLPVDPRLESLLRQVVAANDLQPDQIQRVRARLGLLPEPSANLATPSGTLPASRAATLPRSTADEEQPATIAIPRHRPREQWFQFALAGVAFIAVGVVLALLFGSGNDEPAVQPGTTGLPEATDSATASTTSVTASSLLAVRDALEPLPPEQERRMVLEVETHNQYDNAFDRWTIELWQHWSETGVLSEGLYVSDPAGEVVTHIALNGQQRLLAWEPEDTLQVFDAPLEYSLQRRVLGATLAAVNDPDPHALRSEDRDGLVVLHFEWIDTNAEEFDYLSRGEAWIDPDTGRLQRIVHLVDRPEQEPYPTRTFVVRDMEILPVGSSPAGAYEIAGATVPSDTNAPESLPTPDETGTYNGITFDQAQEIVPFEIVMPEHVPDGLEAPGISVIESPPLAVGRRVYRVEMVFELSGDESPGQAVLLTQIFSPGGGKPNTPEAETTKTTINGVEVYQTTGVNAGGEPLLAYW